MNRRFRDWSLVSFLPKIVAPVVLIQGLDDPFGTMAQIDGISDIILWSRQLRVPDGRQTLIWNIQRRF
jgi:predicted alpha/beta-hydrolase family hydrolase